MSLEYLSLSYTTPTTTNLNIVYNNYDYKTAKYTYNPSPSTASNSIRISQSGINNQSIQYINKHVLTYLNSSNNYNFDEIPQVNNPPKDL